MAKALEIDPTYEPARKNLQRLQGTGEERGQG
jgi:hypothetical protein